MPTNDPNQLNTDPRDDNVNVIARTVLRSFLATPPLSPQDAADVLSSHSFTPYQGSLTDIKTEEGWVRGNNNFPKEAIVIPLPELGDMLYNFHCWVVNTNDVIREMLQETLFVKSNHYTIGNVERLPTGFLKRLKPHIRAGHAVVMEPSAYQEMARAVCQQLADVNNGAQLLGFMAPELYRQALLSDDQEVSRIAPLKKSYPFNGITSKPEWSEVREIVANMLAASNYTPEELSLLQERAKKSENYSFMAMAERQKDPAAMRLYNKMDGSVRTIC